MKKKLFSILLCVLIIVSMVACGASNGSEKTGSAMADAGSSNGLNEMAEDMQEPAEATDFSGIRENAKLIMRAELIMESQNYEQALEEIGALTKKRGGYLESSNQYGETGRRGAFYIIRIPQEYFETFLQDAGNIGQVTSVSQSAEDIADQYSDLETHLKTLQTKHERLLALLESAATMEDIISLENALSETEYQMDSISGTLRSYDSLVDFSTISVNIQEVETLSALSEGSGFAAQVKKAAKSGAQGFMAIAKGLIVVIVTLWPLLLCMAVVIPIVIRFIRKRRTKKEQQDKEFSEK